MHYAKKKWKKPFYDSRPENLRLPDPKEMTDLVQCLQAIGDDAAVSGAADNKRTKQQKLYGTSCFLRLLETSSLQSSSSECSSGGDDNSDTSGDDDLNPIVGTNQ